MRFTWNSDEVERIEKECTTVARIHNEQTEVSFCIFKSPVLLLSTILQCALLGTFIASTHRSMNL